MNTDKTVLSIKSLRSILSWCKCTNIYKYSLSQQALVLSNLPKRYIKIIEINNDCHRNNHSLFHLYQFEYILRFFCGKLNQPTISAMSVSHERYKGIC